MNSNPHRPMVSDSVPGSAEETLRLIASLPAPEGLEDRVHAALRAAPRAGRVLAWPRAQRSKISFESNWVRAATAAAIVFVIAGGGWGVYTRVQRNQPAKVIVMPPRLEAPGGFSGAGAVRTPQTLPGPTVTQPAKASPAQPKAAKKSPAHRRAAGAASAQPDATVKPAAQPATAK